MVHLHIHSNYSLLTGASSVEEIVKTAKDKNIKVLALTDTDGMYGLIKFYKLCLEEGIKPVLGAYITDQGEKDSYALILAKNNKGYSELCKIITSRKLNEDFSLVDIINTGFKNLYFVTPSLPILKKAKIKDNLFAEVITVKLAKGKSAGLIDFAKKNGIGIVGTNPVYFARKDYFREHKVLTAIKENTTYENLSAQNIVNEDYYLKDPDLVKNKLSDLPDAINNSDYIADNCNVDLRIGEYKFPRFQIQDGRNAYSLLWDEAHNGLYKNYPEVTNVELDRLAKELNVISELNFTEYFLIVHDIVKEARKRGMLFIGRGSVANSITAYCLGLSKVDPIKHNLYFERFLNKGRNSPPDIDIDFSWKERDEIVKYVFEKYGYENVAMISTTVTFRAKSAFREVAKAFGFSNEEISKYSKYIPWTDARNLPDISEMFPEAKNINLKIEPWVSIVDIASRIANYPRHLSIHPSGIIITPGPVTDFTALEYASNKGLGLIITQPDMYSIEDLGLIKIDLLSQRSLGVLRDTLGMIKSDRSNL